MDKSKVEYWDMVNGERKHVETEMTMDELRELVSRMLNEQGRFLYTEWWKDGTGRDRCASKGVMKCPGCGGVMSLSRDGVADFSCGKCGRDFFASGSEMAPRHCWGEETGETFSCACPACQHGEHDGTEDYPEQDDGWAGDE